MDLEEANERLVTKITQEELEKITTAYILLDLHKDEFCKIVNVVGLKRILAKIPYYEKALNAYDEYRADQTLKAMKTRFINLTIEREMLEQAIEQQEKAIATRRNK